MEDIKVKFEAVSEEIFNEIEKSRSRWTLKAVTWCDFDDIKLIIFNHIYNKFHLWDQSRPLLPWARQIIKNQIKNALRDKYYKYQKPCEKCAAYKGDDLCNIFNSPNECSLYCHWTGCKNNGRNVQLPVPIENHVSEIHLMPDTFFDVEAAAEKFHKHMQKTLPLYLSKIYTYLYVDNKSEEEVAKILGYKTTENKRANGYRMLYIHKKEIMKHAKESLKNEDLDFYL